MWNTFETRDIFSTKNWNTWFCLLLNTSIWWAISTIQFWFENHSSHLGGAPGKRLPGRGQEDLLPVLGQRTHCHGLPEQPEGAGQVRCIVEPIKKNLKTDLDFAFFRARKRDVVDEAKGDRVMRCSWIVCTNCCLPSPQLVMYCRSLSLKKMRRTCRVQARSTFWEGSLFF